MRNLNYHFTVYQKMLAYFQKIFAIFRSTNREDNITSVVLRIIEHYKVKVTTASIIEYLISNPDFPSLKSICDFFNEINIPNCALKLDEYELYKIDEPFIAHIKDNGGKLLLVYSIDKEKIIYADSLNGRKTISIGKFFEKSDGVVIIIEPTELSREEDFNEKKRNEITRNALFPSVIFVFTVASIFGLVTNKPFSDKLYETSLFIFLFIHFIGLIFSLLLLRHELNLRTEFTDKLCHIATNADCDAVTKSNASKIFGNITWADFGVAYFSGGMLTCFVLPFTYSFNNLALFAIAALPYPIFSLLYQWLKIKKWCPLCLSVQSVIILESAIAFKNIKIGELSITSYIPILIIFSIVFLFLLLYKFLFISEREKGHFKLEALKLKRDSTTFLYKLTQSERIDIQADKSAFIFGDIQNKVLISVFLSFHCSACAKKFDSIVKLIDSNKKIKIQLIFSPASDEVSLQLLKTIFGLLKSGLNKRALGELSVWYKADAKAKLSLFKNNIIPNNNSLHIDFEEMINYNSSLFCNAKVDAVPSVFVNGYLLPNTYSMDEIQYHIAGLEEMQHELNKIEV